jgi:Fe-S cluster biogenesis protein NfuA
LAEALFAIAHVTNVFYVDHWITVTQDGKAHWPELLRALAVPIRDAPSAQERSAELINEGSDRPDGANFDESKLSPAEREKLDAIRQLLDERVRPYLQGDGGDLYVLGLEDHVLKVHYQGACGSCPSSISGTLAGIEGLVREIASAETATQLGFADVSFAYRSPFGDPRPGGSGDATIDYLRDHVLFHAVDPRDVAGVVIEPIIGSGGVQIPPDGFWPALVELCREHGWLLCADEVKSGMGRTGTMFAVEHWGVEPDLMCLGKGIGGGVMPLGAVLGSERAMGGYDDVPTGSTWAWLPAACAAALATLDVYRQLMDEPP